MSGLKDKLRRLYVRFLRTVKRNEKSQDYWNRHHVDSPDEGFSTVEASLEHLAWRNTMYPGQNELLSYENAKGKRVLDYGCGPGNDVIGLGHFGKPAELNAMDVSKAAIALASKRADLHGIACNFIKIDETQVTLPKEDGSIDYWQSMGVLHHTPDPVAIMKELHRLTIDGGQARVMVYNRDSIWRHLFVAWDFQVNKGLFTDLTPDDAFSRTTDGYNCPIADCFSPDTFVAMCEGAGFKASFDDAAVSLFEMRLLPRIWDALGDKRLPMESRVFLEQIRYNERGFPTINGKVAGLNAFYSLEKVV